MGTDTAVTMKETVREMMREALLKAALRYLSLEIPSGELVSKGVSRRRPESFFTSGMNPETNVVDEKAIMGEKRMNPVPGLKCNREVPISFFETKRLHHNG